MRRPGAGRCPGRRPRCDRRGRARAGRGPGTYLDHRSGRGSGRDFAGRGSADRGSATVWSVGAIAVLCAVFGVVLALGHAVVVRHRAAGGADLAALAAADHWTRGGTAACARADRVAREQGTRLVRCVVVGEVSDVSVAAGRGPFTAEIRARAGPPPPPAPGPAPPPAAP
ncbi:flp pilus-assembly TadE/G-like family protein [Streptomyces sp. Tu 3180]|nr:flp pilus-assembly TadE/G-like family protein [Streptomyces sp. Tu 3180]